ncbi:MAG: hypothetical protein KIH89_000040 [Candidatus Shapirobacteria bacterium]|nr:hypothetical protein [Candidatus Shapirobacteria bacterium]
MILFRNIVVLVFLFFLMNKNVVFAAHFTGDCNLVGTCSGSETASYSTGECQSDMFGTYSCVKGSGSISKSCVGAGWGSTCDGCGFDYNFRACTASLCASTGGIETTESGYYYCCSAKSGSCGSADGNSYCPGSPPGSSRCSTSVRNWDEHTNSWTWNCTGTCGGGLSVECEATKLDVIQSRCGTAANVQYYEDVSAPDPAQRCVTNNTAAWVDRDGLDGVYNWTCDGQCDSAVGCSAPNDNIPKITATPALERPTPTIGTPPVGSGTPPVVITPVRPDTRSGVSINNNCQSAFDGTTQVIWKLQITDANGFDDIKSAQLRFTPISGGSQVVSDVRPPNALGRVDFMMDTADFTANTYRVEYQLEDEHNPPGKGPWTYSTRNFKVWDCLLDIGGTFFDSSDLPSGGLCSSNLGYSNAISSRKEFGLVYNSNVGLSSEMVVDSPTFSSNNEDSRKLRWSEATTYVADFRDFPGIEPDEARVNGRCISNITINLGDTRIVDPYDDDPNLQVDYSSIMEQDPWFSVNDGNIFAGGLIDNYVPVTCPISNSTNLGMCATSVHGIIWDKYPSSLLSNFDRCKLQSRNYFNKPIDIGNYTHANLKNEYFTKLGVGTTFIGNRRWSDINAAKDIIFVQGDLEINENINDGQFRVIIASGNITIDTNVAQINAALVASSVGATGIAANQLVINGSVYGYASVDFRRSFADGMNNNDNPSVLVRYDASLPFKMPKEVVKVITQWRME